MKLDDGLRVVRTRGGLISEDEVSVDDIMVGGDQFLCDGVINATLLIVGYEGLAGKDVIKTRFVLTKVTVPGMISFFGRLVGMTDCKRRGD